MNQNQADDIVDELFGGIRSGKEKVGLLGMAFHQEHLYLDFVHGHRMYPLENDKYLELITIFPQGCTEAESLIKWLANQTEWKQVW